MDTTKRLNKLLQKTADTAKKWRHEFVTPEHFLYVLTRDEVFQDCYALNGGDAEELRVAETWRKGSIKSASGRNAGSAVLKPGV